MSDDITFCMIGSCKHKDCFRHNSNIKDFTVPHSYAMFEGTEDCPYEGKAMTYKEAIAELKCYHREDGTVPEEIKLAITALARCWALDEA